MKLNLKSVELVEENGQFYLYAIYSRDKDGIKSEIHIPRIEIPFVRSNDLVINQTLGSFGYRGVKNTVEMDIDVGKGPLFLSKAKVHDREVFAFEEVLEKEMTVEEIEKQLGHKVKIVGEV